MENKNSNEDKLSKPNIKQENEFKKIKLSIEHGAMFGNNSGNIPSEIEVQFLDNIFNFEQQYKMKYHQLFLTTLPQKTPFQNSQFSAEDCFDINLWLKAFLNEEKKDVLVSGIREINY